MQKINIIALHLGHGGIEKYVSSLANMLKDNYEVEITSLYKSYNSPAYEIDSNIKIEYLINEGPYDRSLRLLWANMNYLRFSKEFCRRTKLYFMSRILLRRNLKNLDCDIVITTRAKHNRLVGKYTKNCKKIATEHNFHNNDKKYINKLIKSLKGFDYFVCVSPELKKFYESKIGNTKCVYIPNVIDFNSTKLSKLDNKNVITVGRLSVEKGYSDLLKVIKKVIKIDPEITFSIAGDGDLRKSLEKKVNSLKIQKYVKFLGFVNHDELDKLYLHSSLYVMTSLTESFGIVLIEAMNFGLPCIAFDSASGARCVLKKSGTLIKNRDLNLMAEEIVKHINNKKILKEKSKNSKETAIMYTADQVVKLWYKILE